jgi:hypothetical protein
MIEVRIPISPRDDYYNRVHFIAQSIRSLDAPLKGARIRVTVGFAEDPVDLHRTLPWSRRLGIEWHWVDRGDYAAWAETTHPYIATMMERFRPPFAADTVLMLDADVAVMRPFPELIELVSTQPGVVGTMAHVSPFEPAEWHVLFRHAGLADPDLGFELSGWGIMVTRPEQRFSPAYFNTGVLLAPSHELEQLYDPYMAALQTVRSLHDTYFFEQIALTLALYQTGIAFHAVPLRYNYPNQHDFDAAYPDELHEVAFLHFLRTDIVRREADFADWPSMLALARRIDLAGSNEALRRRLAELLPRMRDDLTLAGQLRRGARDSLRKTRGWLASLRSSR